MGPETAPKHLERKNRFTAVLTVHGKEERITGTFREIQTLNVLDFARKKGKTVLERDLRELNASLTQDLRLLGKDLRSHGLAISTRGKRGSREYGLEEISEQFIESSPVVPDLAKPASSADVAPDFETADKPTTQESVVIPTEPKVLPEKVTIVDFSGNGNGASPKRELPEKHYHVTHMSKEAEEITKGIAYEILSHLVERSLAEIRTSHIEILQSTLLDRKGIRDVFGITTKAELDEYFISFLMANLEKLWDSKSLNSLSIEELKIRGGLAALRKVGYTKEKIEEIFRFYFSIPAPAPTAAAQAN